MYANTKAYIVKANNSNIVNAARRLRNGGDKGLIAFPTETVYGLGACISSDEALKTIFTVKNRPLNNPLIVHVANKNMAQGIVQLNIIQQKIFDCLVKSFWPGPLSLVLPARDFLSRLLTAGGDYVCIRQPNNAIALQLIEALDGPIAAPSANLSGHVSPTCAEHVLSDFANIDLEILDGGVCSVGIESTVVKIEEDGKIKILRSGAVSANNIDLTLRGNLEKFSTYREVEIIQNYQDDQKSSKKQMLSPGQSLSHYAPIIPAYIFSKDINFEQAQFELKNCVIIDFAAINQNLSKQALAYMDLSSVGDLSQAAINLFSMLRVAENIYGATAIILPNFSYVLHYSLKNIELLFALKDRIYRCAAGNFIFL